MIDEERIKQEQHWKTLAQQLGLEEEPEPTSHPARVTEPSSFALGGKVEKSVTEPSVSFSAPIPAELPSPRPAVPRTEEKKVLEIPQRHISSPPERVKENFIEPAPMPESAEPGESQFPGRRPRSRRPGRASEEVATQSADRPTVETGDAEEAPGGVRGERGRRRGRGRSRTKKTESVEETDKEIGPTLSEEVAEPIPAAQQDPCEEEPEEDSEEVDTLSDWNVPSWNDLIASLYRPDR